MRAQRLIKQILKWLLIFVSIILILLYLNNRAIPLKKPAALSADLPEATPRKQCKFFKYPPVLTTGRQPLPIVGVHFLIKGNFQCQ